MSEHRLPRGRVVLFLAASGFLAVGVGFLIARAARFADVLDELKSADARWFPVLLGGEVLAFLGYAMAYRGTARVNGGPRFGFGLSIRLVATSQGGVAVGMGVGGLAVDYWALRRAGEEHNVAVARVLAFNTLEWAVLGAAAAVAAAVELTGVGRGAPWELELAWIAAVPACYVAAAFVTQPGRIGRLTRMEGRGKLGTAFATAIAGVAIVRQMLRHPAVHAEAVGGAVLYWSGLMLCLWGGLHAFGHGLGATGIVLGFATGYAATMLPLPAGGAGSIDAAMTFALNLVGVPLAPALLGVVAYRFFTFWLPLIPALLAGATLKGLRERLPDVPHPGGDTRLASFSEER
ncbi:MAG: flippase-like domain-containing protein [Actinomycetota bacterium]|nr:flippase-like domain-containing protein [Actinomycetota bacterium]